MLKKINKVVYGLSLFSAFILLVMLMMLDVLPTIYLLGITIALLVIYLVFGIFLFKLKNKIGLVFLIFLECILGGAFFFASEKIYETNDFIETLNKSKKEEQVYYVMSLKGSEYKTIENIEGKEVATYFGNDKNEKIVLEKLNKKVSIREKRYEKLSTLGEDLLKKSTDVILVSDFQKELLTERLSGFENKTKVLYKIKISIEGKEEEKEEKKDFDITTDPFIIYISGIDTNGPINTVSRSDVNIIATINPKTHDILLTSIPRDYYVTLHGTTGPKDKLTHAGLYGIDMSVATIEDLLNIKIDYSVRVNFDTLVNVVDTIGGIDVYSDMDFKTYKGYIKKGENHLNGEQALAFSRERKYFAEGDRKRGEHQEEVIRAIINRVTSSKVMLTNYSSILNSLSNTFETTMDANDIKKFVKYQISAMPKWNIRTQNLDGTGSSAYTYSIPTENLYVMVPYEETVIKASTEIKALKESK